MSLQPNKSKWKSNETVVGWKIFGCKHNSKTKMEVGALGWVTTIVSPASDALP